MLLTLFKVIKDYFVLQKMFQLFFIRINFQPLRMASMVHRSAPLIRVPNLAFMAARFRTKETNLPYEAPEWKHLSPREDSNQKKRWIAYPDKERWEFYNEVVWHPHHKERGEPKKGELFYVRERVKHSPTKLWYACHIVRNLLVDEAVKQLQFFNRKSAIIMRESLLEAQQQAVDEGKIEYRSDMYVAEAFCRESYTVKGIRKHGRARIGLVRYRYSDIFIRLEEGQPPENRQRWPSFGGFNLMKEQIQKMRQRRILYGL